MLADSGVSSPRTIRQEILFQLCCLMPPGVFVRCFLKATGRRVVHFQISECVGLVRPCYSGGLVVAANHSAGLQREGSHLLRMTIERE